MILLDLLSCLGERNYVEIYYVMKEYGLQAKRALSVGPIPVEHREIEELQRRERARLRKQEKWQRTQEDIEALRNAIDKWVPALQAWAERVAAWTSEMQASLDKEEWTAPWWTVLSFCALRFLFRRSFHQEE